MMSFMGCNKSKILYFPEQDMETLLRVIILPQDCKSANYFYFTS